MTTRNFNPFQDGYRLINGTKLNDLFKGIMQIPAMAITAITAATVAATGNVTSSAGYVHGSVATTLTAAGTNRSTSLALAAQVNNITTAAASTGVTLPSAATVGTGGSVVVFNNGANAIKVYGAGSDTIDTVAGSTGVTLTNALRCIYYVTAANTWISAQLGVVSA